MKKIMVIAFIIGVMLIIPMAVASASSDIILEDGQVEGTNIRYTVFQDGTLEFYSTEGTGDWSATNRPPWHKYADSIKRVVLSRNMDTVGSYAFADFTSLMEFSCNNPLTFVGAHAFHNTPNLRVPVRFASKMNMIGESAFKDSGITGVTLLAQSWDAHLGSQAFDGCTNLEYIVMNYKNRVHDSWRTAFTNCKSLKYVCLPTYPLGNEKKTCINQVWAALGKGVNIYLGAEAPGSASFSNPDVAYGFCGENISWVYERSVPEEPRKIVFSGSGAIPDYPDVESVPWHTLPIRKIVIGNSISSIGSHAFQNLPVQLLYTGGVQEIGEYAFSGCQSLWCISPSDSGDAHFPYYQDGPPEGKYVWNFENMFFIYPRAFDHAAGKWGDIDTIVFTNRVGQVFNYAFSNLGNVDVVMLPRIVNSSFIDVFVGTDISEVAFEGPQSDYMYLLSAAPLEYAFGNANITFGGQAAKIPNAPEASPAGDLSYNAITGFDPETGADLPDESYIVGLAAGAGLTVRDFIEGSVVAEGAELRVLNADGSSASMGDRLATGQSILVLEGENILYEGEMVLKGDVLGTGVVNTSQLLRLAMAVNGSQPLNGCYFLAGDLADNSKLDITDLVLEAQLLENES